MLERVAMENTGPATRMELAFALRRNLLTGDDGVGKTFLLDVVAWAFAGHWFDRIALPRRSLALLVDEIEAHLHPRWQRVFLPSLLDVARELMPELAVQLFASTHAPLVAASLETRFDRERDALFEFDLAAGEVQVRRAEFRRMVVWSEARRQHLL